MPKSHDSSGPEIQERDWFSEFAPTRFADEVGAGNLGTSILLATPTKSECQDSPGLSEDGPLLKSLFKLSSGWRVRA